MPLPQLPRGKSRSPCHPGQEAAGDQSTIGITGRGTLGVGGRGNLGGVGAAWGHPRPQPVPISAVTREGFGLRGLPTWRVGVVTMEVVTAFLSPVQGAEPPGAGQGGPQGHTHAEGKVGIAATGQARAGPR